MDITFLVENPHVPYFLYCSGLAEGVTGIISFKVNQLAPNGTKPTGYERLMIIWSVPFYSVSDKWFGLSWMENAHDIDEELYDDFKNFERASKGGNHTQVGKASVML